MAVKIGDKMRKAKTLKPLEVKNLTLFQHYVELPPKIHAIRVWITHKEEIGSCLLALNMMPKIGKAHLTIEFVTEEPME